MKPPKKNPLNTSFMKFPNKIRNDLEYLRENCDPEFFDMIHGLTLTKFYLGDKLKNDDKSKNRDT